MSADHRIPQSGRGVLAVDPGPTPGFAFYDEELNDHCAWIEKSFYAGADRIWHMCQASMVRVLVVEGFIIRGPRDKDSNTTIELIGVARYLAMDYGVKFVEQTPGDRASFITTEKLRNAGMWTGGAPDHARSASGHLLLYLVREKLLDARRLLTSESTSTEED